MCLDTYWRNRSTVLQRLWLSILRVMVLFLLQRACRFPACLFIAFFTATAGSRAVLFFNLNPFSGPCFLLPSDPAVLAPEIQEFWQALVSGWVS